MLSNLVPQHKAFENKEQFCFLSYDFKKKIENFIEKNNNPLQFPDTLFIEIEKTIPLSELVFESSPKEFDAVNLQQTVTKEQYIENVNALKEHIQNGDIYEINYCITFEAYNAQIDPLLIYEKLNAISKAPYSAFIKMNKQYIISSSPELFLSKKGPKLITKPIKGTAKRSVSMSEDETIKQHLQHNLKEQTENVMIVDVARNDLSKLAQKGSVSVDKLFSIESYQQVHQMVSSVSCDLKPSTSFETIMNATFPMASMTGAPKIRAMQLIDQFEMYNRNVYSGTIGYINNNENFDLSVLIRSIFYDEEKQYLSFTVGSAITIQCNAEDEYNECLLKAQAMIKVLNAQL